MYAVVNADRSSLLGAQTILLPMNNKCCSRRFNLGAFVRATGLQLRGRGEIYGCEPHRTKEVLRSLISQVYDVPIMADVYISSDNIVRVDPGLC